jgi:hypothetical protein
MVTFTSNALISIVSFDFKNSSILWAKFDAPASSFILSFALFFHPAPPS